MEVGEWFMLQSFFPETSPCAMRVAGCQEELETGKGRLDIQLMCHVWQYQLLKY